MVFERKEIQTIAVVAAPTSVWVVVLSLSDADGVELDENDILVRALVTDKVLVVLVRVVVVFTSIDMTSITGERVTWPVSVDTTDVNSELDEFRDVMVRTCTVDKALEL